MMKKLLTVLFCVALTLPTFAQKRVNTVTAKNVKTLKKRPLKIVLLKNKGKKIIINNNLKKAIESELSFHSKISYITPKEFKQYKKDGVTKYAYLTFSKPEAISTSSNRSTDAAGTKYFSYLAIDEKGKENNILNFQHQLRKKEPLADYYRCVQKIQESLEEWDNAATNSDGYITDKSMLNTKRNELFDNEESNIEKIKTMTLLVDKNYIKKNTIPEFKKSYKYPYKIVEEEEINKAIVNNDKNIAILRKMYIINADTGKKMTTHYKNKDKKVVFAPFMIGSGMFGNFNKKDLIRLIEQFN